MAHIVPFTIGGYQFRHEENHDPAGDMARAYFWKMSPLAMSMWHADSYATCASNGSQGDPSELILFSMLDSLGEFWGTWAIYRIKTFGDGPAITCQPAPLFPDIEITTPGRGITIDEDDRDNQKLLVLADQKRAEFFRRTFGIVEYMMMNEIETYEDDPIIIDHFVLPSVAGGDVEEHTWRDRSYFDQFSKLVTEFDPATGYPIRITREWKEVDPDPERERETF